MTVNATIRSSPGDGLARPSVLLVTIHSDPSGATVNVRSLPYLPTNRSKGPAGVGLAIPTCHNRLPRSAAMYAQSPMIASPLGDASSVGHWTYGSA